MICPDFVFFNPCQFSPVPYSWNNDIGRFMKINKNTAKKHYVVYVERGLHEKHSLQHQLYRFYYVYYTHTHTQTQTILIQLTFLFTLLLLFLILCKQSLLLVCHSSLVWGNMRVFHCWEENITWFSSFQWSIYSAFHRSTSPPNKYEIICILWIRPVVDIYTTGSRKRPWQVTHALQ